MKAKNSNKVVKNLDLQIEETEKDTDSSNYSVFTIRGTANSGLKDRWNEVMPKSCWNLDNYLKNPVVLYEHDTYKPIGKVTEIYSTDSGLKFVAQIGKKGCGLTPLQQDIVKLVEQEVLKTFSVGFTPHDYDYDNKTDTLIYQNAELLEISLTSIPMDANAIMDTYGYKSIKNFVSREDTIMIEKEIIEKIDSLEKNFKSSLELAEKSSKEKVDSLNSTIEKLENEKKALLNDKKSLTKELDEVKEVCEELCKSIEEGV